MAYGFETTTNDLLDGRDLSGKRVLITGGSAGLGAETARAFAWHGADVVTAVRDLAKGERVAEMIRAGAVSGATVELVELDLASLASVRACADRLLAEGKPLDALIANAGVMACPQGKTADGFETQFGTNHLGHFVFVDKLVPLVVAAAPSRIVVLSSWGHHMSDVALADPGFERGPYDPWLSYGPREDGERALRRRARPPSARSRRARAVHPGGIRTELGRHITPETLKTMADHRPANRQITFKTVPQGAATSVWAAAVADADAIGERYCEDCRVAEPLDDKAAAAGVMPYAIDPARADALWAKSEELVGERFVL